MITGVWFIAIPLVLPVGLRLLMASQLSTSANGSSNVATNTKSSPTPSSRRRGGRRWWMMKVNCTHCKQEIKPRYSCPCQSRGRGLESYHDDEDFSFEVEPRDKLFEEIVGTLRTTKRYIELISSTPKLKPIYNKIELILTKIDAQKGEA